MPSPKPVVAHPHLQPNKIGLTLRDYEGSMSTLCAGCGHDSVTAAIVRSFYELDTPPHLIAKLSGIGCSSKTPTYFLGNSHGFNSVHGRMPSVLTGANLANRELIYLGVSGDGDSASIGMRLDMKSSRFTASLCSRTKSKLLVDPAWLLKATQGEITSMKAAPLCAIAALMIGTS